MPNELYKKFSDQWQRIRDVLDGSDVIKNAGTRYLPRLKGMSNSDYIAYKDRALFVNTSARILNVNTGTVTRRTPLLSYPKQLSPYFERTDNFVTSKVFYEVFRSTVRELIAVGRVGWGLDIVLDAEYPQFVFLPTESILDWSKSGSGVLSEILIQRQVVSSKESPFDDPEVENKFFRLYLDANGIYTVDRYTEKEEFEFSVQPSFQGRNLDFIPFVIANAIELDPDPIKPPMIDIVDINLSQYRTSADLEAGRHFVGLPQPVISGAESDSALYIGSTRAWVLPDHRARAYYLEFQGQGLNSLENAIKSKDVDMARFSAMLQDQSSRGSEAEGTVRLRYSSDAASLVTIADSTEALLNLIYTFLSLWVVPDEEPPSIKLNKEFISSKLSHQEIRALVEAWVKGALSDSELQHNLLQGEIIPVSKNIRFDKPVSRRKEE